MEEEKMELDPNVAAEMGDDTEEETTDFGVEDEGE